MFSAKTISIERDKFKFVVQELSACKTLYVHELCVRENGNLQRFYILI